MAVKKTKRCDLASTGKGFQMRSPLSNITNGVFILDCKERILMRKEEIDKRNSHKKSKGLKNVPVTSNQSPTNRNIDYGKEVVNTYQSIPNTHTTDTASNIYYTPLLSDVTNASIPNNDYTSPKFNRRIRKEYLDSKKKGLNVTSPNIPISSTSSSDIQFSFNNSPINRTVPYVKEVVIPYQSNPNQHTTVHSSNIYFTPMLSDITNASITTDDYSSPKFCRSIRKQYRDRQKQAIKSPSVNFQRSTTQASIKLPQSTYTSKKNIQLSSLNNSREKLHFAGEFITNIFCGISKDYLDHGDQSHICETCHAKLWKDEVLRSYQRKTKSSFSLCCGYSKVKLPDVKPPPSDYKSLYTSSDSKSIHFLKNIRRYNSMFSFTSMGGKVDNSINNGNSPYVFRLSGENYHSIGSLIPTNGSKPKFSQLYIYDTENEVANRQFVLGESRKHSSSSTENLDFQIISELKAMLDSHNQLVKSYRMARDCFQRNPCENLKIRLIAKRNKDGRTYNLPTASEVAALIVGDIDTLFEPRDIIVKSKQGYLERISELHPSYLALQYPLLFVYGDDGYRIDILHRDVSTSTSSDVSTSTTSKRHTCTMREYFCYRIQDRSNTFSLVLNSRRLFQQFLVDAYTMIESERLLYIRTQQKKLRCETFENLCSVKEQGKSDVSKIGQRVILPSSFTGSARYMFQNYLDAMSLCKWYGYPDFFITITCNPKWPEVKRFHKDTTLNPEDRPDILCRLFKIKLDSIIKDLRDNAILGKLQAVVYTVEFQKRGLPHAHLCLFMHADHKLPTVDYIDPFISAEIPDKDKEPELYFLVSEFMIHGPCGVENMNCPCMIDGKCSKNFPKKFRESTCIDGDGFPVYRRRNNGVFIEKSDVKLDNRSVVPYNKILLQRYQAHINVEWCNQAGSIKYLFKYINKGHDMASICFVPSKEANDQEKTVDEIKDYYSCRYISACEASWRIFSYDIHYRNPSVIRLPFHLPGQQHVIYEEFEEIEDVLDKPSVNASMFLQWFVCNEKYPAARQLTYVEFPTKFVWKINKRKWKPRKRGFSIGRIHSVSPSVGEAYYLRILLNKVKGPRNFEDIRTVNDVEYPTFRDACYAYGLLDDDNEYVEAIIEASFTGSGYYLRSLFCTMLMSESMSRPEFVWEKTFTYLSDDILYKQRRILKHPGLVLNEDQIKNLTLFEIQKFLLRNNSTLKRYSSMPFPNHDCISSANNLLLSEELAYDKEILAEEFRNLFSSLTHEQRVIYEEIITAVDNNKGGVFFVYGYGGTGKTYLWKTLCASIRSEGKIVLSVASSGIASLLLSGGRTAHSRFHIPINLDEDSFCFIKPDSDLARLLQETSLIIWDEAPMVHKHGFEALDRSLKDLFRSVSGASSELPFGGKVIVFGGDFRQILPVVPGGSRQQIVNASLSSSYIWRTCKVLKLTKNLRLSTSNDPSEIQETTNFANWLLDIGEGNVGGVNDGNAILQIPEDLLIKHSSDPISELIEFVYPSLIYNFNEQNYFHQRAILAPTNDVVQEINDRMLSLFPGVEKEYLSSDSICPTEMLNENLDDTLCSPDILNGIKASGLPNHRLVFKVGVPVMLLRNIDQKSGLCNGTRLKVVSLGKRVIQVEIISGSHIGDRHYIPRITLIPTDKKLHIKLQRRQFPLAVSFAMTINKSQGQSLSRVGLFLKNPVFTHGQLYVALSRVTRRDGLKIVILDSDGNLSDTTSNVVYKEVFRNL
ncbi:uncharacterized protein LOC110870171 [Helianthus annuus]|uniref:uncharacterized protein LOC110870171 n=1 Tax=Helianthus annuus TaxID=4232 RepID=UPI000B8FFE3A|nr:uncharacterized protein LOC110870171 [Helianthus annuus]